MSRHAALLSLVFLAGCPKSGAPGRSADGSVTVTFGLQPMEKADFAYDQTQTNVSPVSTETKGMAYTARLDLYAADDGGVEWAYNDAAYVGEPTAMPPELRDTMLLMNVESQHWILDENTGEVVATPGAQFVARGVRDMIDKAAAAAPDGSGEMIRSTMESQFSSMIDETIMAQQMRMNWEQELGLLIDRTFVPGEPLAIELDNASIPLLPGRALTLTYAVTMSAEPVPCTPEGKRARCRRFDVVSSLPETALNALVAELMEKMLGGAGLGAMGVELSFNSLSQSRTWIVDPSTARPYRQEFTVNVDLEMSMMGQQIPMTSEQTTLSTWTWAPR